MKIGISQISGGSRTSVGGYCEEERDNTTSQFDVNDTRPLAEVMQWLVDSGYIPSFCTACYRQGRTGDRFMPLAKSGQIHNTCLPNALLTLSEYAIDYGDDKFKESTKKLIKAEIEHIDNPVRKEKAKEYLKLIEEGQRDFRF